MNVPGAFYPINIFIPKSGFISPSNIIPNSVLLLKGGEESMATKKAPAKKAKKTTKKK
jgi:hypothetical protein